MKHIDKQKQKFKQILLHLATVQAIKSEKKNISEYGVLLKTNYKHLEMEMKLGEDSIRKYLISLKNRKFIQKQYMGDDLLIYIINKKDIDRIKQRLKRRECMFYKL